MTNRIDRVNEVIKVNLSKILQKDISFKKGLFVSILKVDTSKNLQNTKIHLSIFPQTEAHYVEKTLEKEYSKIQNRLNKSLHIKIFPQIRFVTDKTQEYVDELEKVFDQIKKEKNEK